MKDFVKMTLAVVCGLFVFGIVAFILSISMLSSVAAASSSAPLIPKSGVMVVDMSEIVLSE
ncbi:MAG: hypothetical protein Q4G10_08000, partial [Bacteroidia bacterium]|nr:hypothetical protein [Bacteroidia bacterium]